MGRPFFCPAPSQPAPLPPHRTAASASDAPERKPRPLVDVLVSIVVPSLILMRLSGEDRLGPTGALLLALAFPIGYGLHELLRHGHRNVMALLGIVSVLLTGGIGLLEIDARWLAVKEAAVPLAIGAGLLIAHRLGYPVVRKLLFNPALMNVDRIEAALDERGTRAPFERRLDRANTLFAGTFVFSSIMNWTLARLIVTSPGGTPEFNEELGRMTLLSYPVIAIPSMLMMMGIFWFVWRTVARLTGLGFEQIMTGGEDGDGPDATS